MIRQSFKQSQRVFWQTGMFYNNFFRQAIKGPNPYTEGEYLGKEFAF